MTTLTNFRKFEQIINGEQGKQIELSNGYRRKKTSLKSR